MKRFLVLISALACIQLLGSCSNSKPQESQDAAQAQSTSEPAPTIPNSAAPAEDARARALAVKAYVDSVENSLPDKFDMKEHRPNRYSERDFIGLLEHNGEPFRYSSSLYPKDAETRTLYYMKDNILVYIKHREWFKTANPPFAREIQSFLDENGIFYTLDRYVELKKDERPGPLLAQPIGESRLNRDSLNQVINAEFKVISGYYSR
ncbi:MAG: hypothetical protein RI973_1296 [Bacteroidota bacterium]|jgi:hypothetical protein